ncbi:MAG: AraC family transcriptional regulator [Ferruginibacter sp.]
MIVFEINHTNYIMLLKDLAAALNLPVTGDDFIVLTPPAGEGTMKVLSLFDDLQVLLTDASFGQKLLTVRSRSDTRYFILHFDDVYINDTARFTVDAEILQKSNSRHAVARLTSNIFNNTEEIPANVHIKSVKILINEQWLKKYFGLNSNADVLQKYLSLKTESFDIEKLDAEYLKLMDSLWSEQKMEPLHNIFLQNRVTLLMERFFTRLHDKMNLLEGGFKLNEEDVQRLIRVEQLLVNDFSETPPTIDEFSRIVSMSGTKLKKNFKSLYGDSIYAYYQKSRMQKAKVLLMSTKYNVKETAEAIGYNNTSNFIAAFKKQYHISPGEMIAS